MACCRWPALTPDPIDSRSRSQVRHVGVRFEPGVAPAVLGVAASELRDQRVDLADIWGQDVAPSRWLMPSRQRPSRPRSSCSRRSSSAWSRSMRRLQTSSSWRWWRSSGTRARAWPPRHTSLVISERQLRRRCEIAIGYGPKTLDRVLRFQRFCRLAERRGGTLAQLAVESGYADQAHLSREYARLAGTTPARATTISLAV